MDWLTTDALIALGTLTLLGIVLGIDNIVFLSILTGKLPPSQRPLAQRLGLGLALVSRLALLFAISWVMGLTRPWFTLMGHGFSGRDLILLGGGLFLIAKATSEIYEKLEVESGAERDVKAAGQMAVILVQIMVLDVVFSLDSVITAVGMAERLWVMVTAMVAAVGVMLAFAGMVSDFVIRHPSVKILALSFLLLIGVMLTAEGMGQHVSKGYIYSAMAFSLFVETLNMRFRHKHQPLGLHGRMEKH